MAFFKFGNPYRNKPDKEILQMYRIGDEKERQKIMDYSYEKYISLLENDQSIGLNLQEQEDCYSEAIFTFFNSALSGTLPNSIKIGKEIKDRFQEQIYLFQLRSENEKVRLQGRTQIWRYLLPSMPESPTNRGWERKEIYTDTIYTAIGKLLEYALKPDFKPRSSLKALFYKIYGNKLKEAFRKKKPDILPLPTKKDQHGVSNDEPVPISFFLSEVKNTDPITFDQDKDADLKALTQLLETFLLDKGQQQLQQLSKKARDMVSGIMEENVLDITRLSTALQVMQKKGDPCARLLLMNAGKINSHTIFHRLFPEKEIHEERIASFISTRVYRCKKKIIERLEGKLFFNIHKKKKEDEQK